jgi:outer membrane protein OmpA-like peptidoglycan-associated protein
MVKIALTYFLVMIGTLSIGQDCEIKVLETNFRGAVFSPTFYQNKLVVCSNQKDRFLNTVIDQSNKEPIDLYIVNPNDLDSIKKFDNKFRTDYNDGPISFNETGDKFVITRNLNVEQSFKSLQSEANRMGLFYCVKENQEWQNLIPLPFNDTAYHCTHPALNEAGDVLIFSSNMSGGFGGLDLWKCTYKDEKWSKPINLGSEINTEQDELFPSINGNTVYFSSDRKAFGGLDIYKFNLNAPSGIKVLGDGINSKFDDFSIVSVDNFSSGYFSSNRNGEDQIWSFKYDRPVFGPCDSLVNNNMCYTLFEENVAEIGEEESLIFQWHINDVTKTGAEVDYCFPGPGDYEITLDIIDTVVQKTYYNQSYYYLSLQLEEQPYITAPDTVLIGQSFKLSSEGTNLPDMSIDSFHWQISDGAFYEGEEIQHTFNKTGLFEIQLGVIGNQDEIKAKDCVYRGIYCIDSAEWVKTKPLSKNAIEDEGLVKNVVHFYDTPNDSTFLVYTIEVVRADEKFDENNTIFTLLKPYGDVSLQYVEHEDKFLYLVGQWENLEDVYPTWKELVEKGFDKAIVRSVNVDEVANFQIDETFVLNNVQFAYNSWEISTEVAVELQQLIDLLVLYPKLKLSIEAHTDSEGKEKKNMELSIQRAEAVQEFLVTSGIEQERITAKGFGETVPLESNETEEGKRKNRRVEFTFIKE